MTATFPTQSAIRTPTLPRLAAVGLELLLLGVLVGAAFAVRLPYLLTVPRFTDEQIEVLYALPLYRLQAFPLIGPDPYNGPLHTILVATGLWLLGPQPETSRLVSVLVGTATVGATYLLGRQLGGWLAGLIAAGLLTTSAGHVLVNSHVAWSSSTTPLFTTAAMAVMLPAFTRLSRPHLAGGALLLALALQTHPSVAAFLPGVGLALLARPRLLRSRWLLIAALLFVLGYSNVAVYNLLPDAQGGYRQVASSLLPDWFTADGASASRLAQQQRTYSGGQGGPEFYLANLGSLAHNLPRLAASLVETEARWTEYLAQPSFWAYGGLLLVGLAWPFARGVPLPTLAGGSFLLLLPFLTGKFEPIFNGRYLMPLLPLAFAGFGAAIAHLWAAVRGPAPRLVLGASALVLIVYPLFVLVRFEQRSHEDGQVNVDLIGTAAAAARSRSAGEPLLLDEALGRRSLPADGDLLLSLRLLLELRRVEYLIGPASAGKLEPQLDGARTALVVFAQPYERDLERRFRIQRIEERGTGRYGLYRLERR